MKYALSTAILPDVSTTPDIVTGRPQSDGSITFERADGTVVSTPPSGGRDTRPTGTAGPWEKFLLNGSVAVAYPDPTSPPYAYACFALPNT